MSDYEIGKVYTSDHKTLTAIDKLLQSEGIRRDKNLDYICAMYDEEMNVIATGSCFGNSLRCLAVSAQHQGEGLMNKIVTHLVNIQFERGNYHLFLYTKCDSAKFFHSLGFYEISRIDGQIVFMENKRGGFQHYLNHLASKVAVNGKQKIAALVMNANPFTLGHQYLVEKAAQENDIVHLFMVSEDQSLIPYAIRKRLILAGTAHLKNVYCHDSGSYIISSATFPSYFQPDDNAVIQSNALIDLQIFTQIATALGIQRRYVGDEPFSRVTNLYNQIMQQKLPEHGIECIVVPRISASGQIISASAVRQAIKENDFTALQQMVPQTTYDFFISPEANEIIAKIQKADNVKHY